MSRPLRCLHVEEGSPHLTMPPPDVAVTAKRTSEAAEAEEAADINVRLR
jgi:hypothetical protein